MINNSTSIMFSSPSIRLYTSENADNLVQKKPVNNLSRKPFLDRSVNSKTPDTGKLLKPKLNVAKETAVIGKPNKSPKDDLNADEFTFSFKEKEDSYEDIWPNSHRLNTESLVKILRNYCNAESTPPPSPGPVPMEINPIFVELPDLDEPQLLDDTIHDDWNKTFDVEVPECDLDMSV